MKYVYRRSPSEVARILLQDLLGVLSNQPEQVFRIALSGGNTPALLFRLWTKEFAVVTPWERLQFYWADERCVPPEHHDSNYGMANRLLFVHVPVRPKQIHRIAGENTPHEEAIRYSSLVNASACTLDNMPRFDMVLLGIGTDGHTASIFPGQTELLQATSPYKTSKNPHTGQDRITLTGKALVQARHTWFMAVGKEKQAIIRTVTERKAPFSCPARYILRHAKEARLYTDFPPLPSKSQECFSSKME